MPDTATPKLIRTVFDDPPLKIRYLPGTSATLVVSFAGIGGTRSEEPPAEFVKIASDNGSNHVLFVTDIWRSWLNAPHMAEQIVETVERTKARISARRVVMVGNSMGGFSALRIARLMPVDAVAAFSPQYSPDPSLVPDDHRWSYFRRKIRQFRFRRIDALPEPPTVTYIFQGGTRSEAYHWRRFPFAENADQYVFPGIGHNLAHHLKQRRVLRPLVADIIAGRRRRVRQRVKAHGGISRPFAT